MNKLVIAGIAVGAYLLLSSKKKKRSTSVSKNPRRRRNPSGNGLYEDFHGVAPANLRNMQLPVPQPGQKLTKIGRLTHVVYQPENPSKLAGTLFEHKWGDTGYKMLKDKPILATDGKNFYIIPDKAKPYFNERGIIG